MRLISYYFQLFCIFIFLFMLFFSVVGCARVDPVPFSFVYGSRAIDLEPPRIQQGARDIIDLVSPVSYRLVPRKRSVPLEVFIWTR